MNLELVMQNVISCLSERRPLILACCFSKEILQTQKHQRNNCSDKPADVLSLASLQWHKSLFTL